MAEVLLDYRWAKEIKNICREHCDENGCKGCMFKNTCKEIVIDENEEPWSWDIDEMYMNACMIGD